MEAEGSRWEKWTRTGVGCERGKDMTTVATNETSVLTVLTMKQRVGHTG